MEQRQSFFKRSIEVLKNTWAIFSNVNGLKFSASLAYYTIFSIAPLLMLVISLVALILGDKAIEGEIYKPMEEILGSESALQLQSMIGNLRLNSNNVGSLIISILTLLLGATTVFGDMQNSINQIWNIKPKPKKGWVKMLKDRLLSGSLILSLGFLLIVSFVVNSLVVLLLDKFTDFIAVETFYLTIIVDYVINFLVISVLFGIIFKFLPDVNIKWKEVRNGAIFTSLLFMLGRFLISYYIGFSVKTSAYGAAGSIIVILVWVYYSAAILYLGASFTRANAEYKGVKIFPAEYAVIVEQKEVEIEDQAIPVASTSEDEESEESKT